MPDAGRSERPGATRSGRGRRRTGRLSLAAIWRRWNAEQRVAAVAAVLLVVGTIGPFSFVEAAVILVAGAVLVLLEKRAEEAEFHLPFGDGTVIAGAGAWCAVLILVRLFDRPLGQGLLALASAALLVAAGVRERAKRPADDLPAVERPADDLPAAPERADQPPAGLEPADEEPPTERLSDRAAEGPEPPRR